MVDVFITNTDYFHNTFCIIGSGYLKKNVCNMDMGVIVACIVT